MKITDHYLATAKWLMDWADGYDSGQVQHHSDGVDASKEMANTLRHKARNIEAVVIAYKRLYP